MGYMQYWQYGHWALPGASSAWGLGLFGARQGNLLRSSSSSSSRGKRRAAQFRGALEAEAEVAGRAEATTAAEWAEAIAAAEWAAWLGPRCADMMGGGDRVQGFD